MTQGPILSQPPRSIKWEETLHSGVQLSSSKGDGGGLGCTCIIMTSEAGGTLPCGSEQRSESLTSMELAGSSWEMHRLCRQPSLPQCCLYAGFGAR